MNIARKLFKDLTDEEVLEIGLEVVPEFRRGFQNTGEFDVSRCVQVALGRIERLYKSKHGLYQNMQISRRERQELTQVLERFRPLLYERVSAIRQRLLQTRKVTQINAATAKILIGERFREAGLNAKVTGQVYRARVEVSLGSRHVRFYVNYKKMLQEGVLDKAVTAVQDLVKALDGLGYGAVIE